MRQSQATENVFPAKFLGLMIKSCRTSKHLCKLDDKRLWHVVSPFIPSTHKIGQFCPTKLSCVDEKETSYFSGLTGVDQKNLSVG